MAKKTAPAKAAKPAKQDVPSFARRNQGRVPQAVTGLRGAHNTSPARMGQPVEDGREYKSQVQEESTLPEIDPLTLEPPPAVEARKVHRFRTDKRNYAVLIEAPPPSILAGGKLQHHRPVVARFDSKGEYSTTSLEIAQKLRSCKSFGPGLDFWDADEEEHAVGVAQLAAFEDGMRKRPGLMKSFLSKLKRGDFNDVLEAIDDVDADAIDDDEDPEVTPIPDQGGDAPPAGEPGSLSQQ